MKKYIVLPAGNGIQEFENEVVVTTYSVSECFPPEKYMQEVKEGVDFRFQHQLRAISSNTVQNWFEVTEDRYEKSYHGYDRKRIAVPLTTGEEKKEETQGEQIDNVPMDFVVWYSGMERVKIKKAYLRWMRETYPEMPVFPTPN